MLLPVLLLAALVGVARPTGAAAQAPSARCEGQPRWEELLEAHLLRYPRMVAQDAYKLLFHATLGAEHAAPTPEGALAWLREELHAMGGGPDEPLVDTLGAGSRLARIHLRPFQASQGDPDQLAAAFVRTAALPLDTTALTCALGTMRSMAEAGRLPWTAVEVADYLDARRREGYPAVHHSSAFRDAYRPAYRVIALEFLPPP